MRSCAKESEKCVWEKGFTWKVSCPSPMAHQLIMVRTWRFHKKLTKENQETDGRKTGSPRVIYTPLWATSGEREICSRASHHLKKKDDLRWRRRPLQGLGQWRHSRSVTQLKWMAFVINKIFRSFNYNDLYREGSFLTPSCLLRLPIHHPKKIQW